MRSLCFLAFAAIGLMIPAQAREQADFRERAKHAVERADKDLSASIHRDNLDADQRAKFDAAVKDLHELHDAMEAGKWEGGLEKLDHAIDDIDFVVKHAPLGEQEKTTLGIDLYTLRDIRDGWKP
jgi:hypothetical protein